MFPSLEERLGFPQTFEMVRYPAGKWSPNNTANNTSALCADQSYRVSVSHASSDALVASTAPSPDSTSETEDGLPSATENVQEQSLQPCVSAKEPEERASDSGAGSGEEFGPDESSDLSTPRCPVSHPLTTPNRQPQLCTADEVPGSMPTARTTTAMTAVRAAVAQTQPEPQRDGADPVSGESAPGGSDPGQQSPRESVLEREQQEPAPRLPEPAAAGLEEEPKDPSLAELGITAELCSRDLWLEFHEHGTEMIITKMGR